MLTLLPALGLGLALAADAFAAALCQGVAARHNARPHGAALMVGASFGAAQAIAPLLGWSLGLAFASVLAAVDHWIAFVILTILGGKLILEGLKREDGACVSVARGWALAALAVATSIDAAAAGLALPAMGLGPLFAAGVIGAVTFAVCVAGVYLGRIVGPALGRRAEIVGGAALILIGVKILHDHGAI